MSVLLRCKECDGPVRWARTTNGAVILMDRTPSPDGSYVVDRMARDRYKRPLPIMRPLRATSRPGARKRFAPHVATCTTRRAVA